MSNIQRSYDAEDLIALRFDTEDDCNAFITMYRKRRPGQFLSRFGQLRVIVPEQELSGLQAELSIPFIGDTVKSIRELSPEKAAELRKQRGRPRLSDAEENRLLETLSKQYSVKIP
jgi:hypothetical protein